MPSEHEIQKSIMRELSMHKCTVFRANVGKVLMENGRWFDTGLPKGHPDLYGLDGLMIKCFTLKLNQQLENRDRNRLFFIIF